MTREKKELLFKDLCERLPYGVKYQDKTEGGVHILTLGIISHYERFIPFLRPMSSMTKEEYEELKSVEPYYGLAPFKFIGDWGPNFEVLDWLNAHHFDYRGLIEKGLALEAPEGMYE